MMINECSSMININFIVLGHLDYLAREHLDSFDEIGIFFCCDDDFIEYFLGKLAQNFENFFKKLLRLPKILGVGQQDGFKFALYPA